MLISDKYMFWDYKRGLKDAKLSKDELKILNSGYGKRNIREIHNTKVLQRTAAIIGLSFVLKNYLALRKSVAIVLALLTIQVALGIINVVMSLPMFAATMHNVVGLALLLSLINLAHKMFSKENAL